MVLMEGGGVGRRDKSWDLSTQHMLQLWKQRIITSVEDSEEKKWEKGDLHVGSVSRTEAQVIMSFEDAPDSCRCFHHQEDIHSVAKSPPERGAVEQLDPHL